VQFRLAETRDDGRTSGRFRELLLRLSRPPGAGLTIRLTGPPIAPLRELDGYAQKVIKLCRRGAMHPYELIPMITRSADRKRGWLTLH
jgi:hypothetical protein